MFYECLCQAFTVLLELRKMQCKSYLTALNYDTQYMCMCLMDWEWLAYSSDVFSTPFKDGKKLKADWKLHLALLIINIEGH